MSIEIRRVLSCFTDTSKLALEIDIDNNKLPELKMMVRNAFDETYDPNLIASYSVTFKDAQEIASWVGKTIPFGLYCYIETFRKV